VCRFFPNEEAKAFHGRDCRHRHFHDQDGQRVALSAAALALAPARLV
jgi:hypothetical protein